MLPLPHKERWSRKTATAERHLAESITNEQGVDCEAGGDSDAEDEIISSRNRTSRSSRSNEFLESDFDSDDSALDKDYTPSNDFSGKCSN
ncbi:Protein of unknown function [Gryllus bimaculatus]|nr:Protein of unknown function [Gryllus bimaculatus]